MPSIERPSGIRLEVGDGVEVRDIQTGRAADEDAPRTRRGRVIDLPSGPVDLGSPEAPEAADPVAASMATQDMLLLDSFEVLPKAPSGTRRAAVTRLPERFTAEIPAEEDAAVLLEQDGFYTWQFPTKSQVVPGKRGAGPLVAPSRRRVTFDITITAGSTPQQRRTRGAIADFVVDKVRVFVFRFLARVATQGIVSFLERHITPGIVVMDSEDPTAWRRIENLSELTLPQNRPARLLLFVHGTFSSTVGSYGALGASGWGREFLAGALEKYDAIIGYDHATLGLTPMQNATDLLARLEAANFSTPPDIDAVSFSRGALVLRALTEFLLPNSRLGSQVRRAVFVGATNGGTELANAKNWKRLIDVWTNLAAAASRALGLLGAPALAGTILSQTIATLGALVKYLATAAVEDRAAPGLADMTPKSEFIRTLNTKQKGQPTALATFYCVITSDFDVRLFARVGGAAELPKRFVTWALDGLADALMQESNDLVVHCRAMSEIDPGAESFVKDRLDFGANAQVYHTVYFTRPEVAAALSKWLQIAPGSIDLARRSLPASASYDVMSVKADDDYQEVVDAVAKRDPEYVIVERTLGADRFQYAFRPDELLGLNAAVLKRATRARSDATLEQALALDRSLELREDRRSRGYTATQPQWSEGTNPSARRRIVIHGDAPVGVVGTFSKPRSIDDLSRESGGAAALPPSKGLVEAKSAVTRPPHAARPRAARRAAPSAAAPRAAAGAGKPALATWNVAASIPEKIQVRKTTVLDITLSREEIAIAIGVASQAGKFVANPDKPLLIQVIPKRNVEAVADTQYELTPSEQPTYQLAFPIRATDVGTAEIWVRVLQGPLVLTNLVLKPEVIARKPAASVGRVNAAEFARPPAESPPRFPVLQIFEIVNGSDVRFRFSLDLGNGSYPLGNSKPLQVSREQYVTKLYQDIESRWVSSNRDAKRFDAEMRTYGGELFDQLIPGAVQAALWEVRDELESIQVVSEEPFIPWEIVHLKPPQQVDGRPAPLPADEHFLATKGLVRWLHNRGEAAASMQVRAEHSFYIVPVYPKKYELPAAQEEIPHLQKLLKAGPLAGDSTDVLDALKAAGKIDLLHFSGHASADAVDATTARVMLQGTLDGSTYYPDYLNARDIRQHAAVADASGAHPLVFLNACQSGRQGWYLTEVGGFADAFLLRGVGAFVGTLWEVGDTSAKHFAIGFYQALRAKKTLAEAASEGRRAARDAGEPTWLAYVVYGHPAARVALP